MGGSQDAGDLLEAGRMAMIVGTDPSEYALLLTRVNVADYI